MLVNNMVVVKFLGLCPLMGVSRRHETALGMGLATCFVLTLSSGLSYLVNANLLEPLDAGYLRTIVFIVVIAVVVQFSEQVIQKASPLLAHSLGIYLPLITTNCAVLGVALLNIHSTHSVADAVIFGFGTSLGFTLVLVLFSGIRERLEGADIPSPFRGNAIAFITAGIISIAFAGFAGMTRN